MSDGCDELLTEASLALDSGGEEAALARVEQAVALAPDRADAQLLHGAVLVRMQRFDAALAAFDRAIALDASADGFTRRGKALLKLGRYAQALGSFTRATALDPGHVDGWAGMARAFNKLERYPLAIGAYRRALALAPDRPFLRGRLLQQMVVACDWRELAPLIAEIEGDIAAGRKSARPFVWSAVCGSPQSLHDCARIFSGADEGERRPMPAPAQPRASERIRLGYLTGEFREHPTSIQMVGLYEAHDKAQFELFGFDNGWDDGGPTRARINRAMDHIVPIGALSDAEAAARIAGAGIDILIDCNGFYGRNRAGLCARRPAPVQFFFPGYPGTLGTAHFDYILADAIVVPPDHRRWFSEQLVQMPHSYQPNDRWRPIGTRDFARAELGLPETGAVFCCFNNNYKIIPTVFAAWMQILRAVPGSVLWLLADNPVAVANLRNEACAHGVDADRLVFAARMPVADHLARHRVADLFLDTLPYNAHATAADCLWAGVPLLTCLGTAFAGRVAASVLHAIGLPDLIAPSLDAYVAQAIHLGTHPDALAGIRSRLAQNRLTTPLFDTALFTRHLERAYREMHRRRRAGLSPAPITVTA